MLREAVEVLDLHPGSTVVDGTVGAGGHSAAFAVAISPGGLLVGLDRDAEILAHAESALREVQRGGAQFEFRLRHASFAGIEETLAAEGVPQCDRVFLDLGVSSKQLDSPERGFSYQHDGPLDMRMDRTASTTAAEWLRSVTEPELERTLRDFGEERHARRIARAIVAGRRRAPIERTGQLREVVWQALPPPARRQRIHPATRVFQAIRIAVNGELLALESGLEAGLSSLRPGGRLAVIAFHSLEDRLVKRFLRGHAETFAKKPLRAGRDECGRNPRARSAKLRWGAR